MRKVYCVDGLIEWHCCVKAGRLMLPIEFTGGHVSGYGVVPAEYSTADPVLQRAIEQSPFFKSGRIRIKRR